MPQSTARPILDDQGLPPHGVDWDEGVVLRVRSRGAGVPVPVSNPRAGKPRRVVSGAGSVRTRNGKVEVAPSQAQSGEELAVVVEY